MYDYPVAYNYGKAVFHGYVKMWLAIHSAAIVKGRPKIGSIEYSPRLGDEPQAR
ncbi:MAG: hypothetical protein JSV51_01285 [Candidatus Bathyarchaeota archaeon]|nr:MAG: hypothetical protein JSV51_01285 [Candidatus Bathyarchaeota archaeon]